MNPKSLILIGSILGFFGVAFGAFGAHFLKSRLSPEMLAVFETGIKYHLIHALALLVAAVIGGQYSHPFVRYSGWLFFAGILIFSGSLYLLAITGVKEWGAVTPVGGILLLAGWLSLAIGIARGS